MFTRKTIMAVSFCLLFVFVVSEGKAEDPENLDLAIAFVEVSGSASMFDSAANSLVQHQEELILSRHPKLDPETLEKFKTILWEELFAQKPDLIHLIAVLSAKHFTREDLQGLIAFYQSDLGKKTVQAGLAMQDDLFRLSSEWAITAIQRAGTRAHARLKEQGIEL